MADLPEEQSLAAGVSTAVFGGQTILFGTGASDRALAGALAKIGTSRVAIVCNRSVADAGTVRTLAERALRAAAVVARLDTISAGVPAHEVEKVAAEWRPLGIDTLVAIGGGSAIDTAKALSLLLSGVGSELSDFFVRPGEVRDYPGGDFPAVVAVPTTLSGAEVTASAGISTGGEKRLIRVEQISPRIVCADPANLLPTPQPLLASTGFCALAHGIEAVYSVKRNPVSTALALRSAALLGAGLGELSAGAPVPEQAAGPLASGATLAALALKGCSSGLQHVICRVLGGSAGLPHGVGHSIMLPSVLRYNRPSSQQEQECFSKAAGVFRAEAEGDLAGQIERLRELTGAPASLHEAGLSRAQLAGCAQKVFRHSGLASNPRAVASEEEILAILDAAW
ncbi:MAG: iron-containing alcohol dehydrogenase family protein [Streptosporangiaceae bacterium]